VCSHFARKFVQIMEERLRASRCQNLGDKAAKRRFVSFVGTDPTGVDLGFAFNLQQILLNAGDECFQLCADGDHIGP
jgi:hypothetical protein